MTIKTPLNGSPYFDDYDANKDFYKVLFKPSVGVQVRELNQLQTILQSQIERFGDNIFKRGTIINGCNFIFETTIPYVKIVDTNTDGGSIEVSDYRNMLVSGGTTGLKAYVINTYSGFVATDPNLNTLYVKYTSGGSNTTTTAFVNNEILTIYDNNNSIWSVKVDTGSSLYSNNDGVVFVSAITVTNSSGGNAFVNSTAGACTFSAGQTLVGGTSTANLIITEVNTTINTAALVLKVRPITADLTALSANTARWTLTNAELVSVSGGVQSANINSIIGLGATATLITDTSGSVANISMTARGSGYYTEPYVTIKSNTGSFATLSLTGRNYYAKANVAAVSNSTGYGYSFGVTEGVIYQKGYFQRVEQQSIIVDKYSNTPNQVVVGFTTREVLVNSASDSTLLDIVTGTTSEVSPGADRLSLIPTLETMSVTNAAANDSFFTICTWTNGKPNSQLQRTQYNVIENEMAQREFETAGNFVTDPFFVTTTSPSTQNLESNTFSIVIDPGIAYIEGYRVQSQYNYTENFTKATESVVLSNNAISLNYGNYVRIYGLGGLFQFNSGDTISLYDTAQNFLSVTTLFNAAISPAGAAIGTARIRSLTYEGGTPQGTPQAVYRLYLFDIKMNSGKNFKDTKSVYYLNSALSRSGIADILLEPSSTTGANSAVLKTPVGACNQIVFYSGVNAVKNSNNINYSYRTIKSANCNTSGIIVATLSASEETFPYTAGSTLTSGQTVDLVIIPAANIVATVNTTGTVSVNTTSANIIGSSTTFTSQFTSGDYIRINGGASGNTTKRIENIVNNTLMILDSNCSFANATAGAFTILPANIPVNLNKSTRSANINGSGKTLTINLGNTYSSNVNVEVSYSVYVANATITTKTPNRNVYVKIKANTNVSNTVGPWLLGVPDIFRLKGVWQGANATFTDVDGTNVTDHFFIDHNQNEDFYDLGYLYKKPTSTLAVGANDAFIVKFDCFTVSSGAMATYKSYPVDDTKTLTQLDASGTVVNLLEIPEMYTSSGSYIDLRDAFDFRPRVANTANLAPNTSVMTTDPTYPANTAKFGNTANSTADFKFPAPQSGLNCVIENYLPRVDLVIVNSNGNFQVVKGNPGGSSNFSTKAPMNSMIINYLVVPAYPSLPKVYSSNLAVITDTKMTNQKYLNQRLSRYSISIPINSSQVYTVQPQAYKMEDIGKLERRIRTLEYYQSLSLLEASFNDKIIPSSSNTAINRFKFGFFVDGFENQNYSDLTNPEYNATVLNGRLTSAKEQLNFVFSYGNTATSGKIATLPYIEYPLLQQLNATDGAVSNTNSNTEVSQTRVCVSVQQRSTLFTTNGSVVDITSYQLSNTAGSADIYADFLKQFDRIEVYQNTSSTFDYTVSTPLVTSDDTVLLTSGERSNLTSNGALSGFAYSQRANSSWDIINRPDFSFGTYNADPAYYFKNAGKISWTHNPTNGNFYKLVVKKFSPYYSYYFCYPIDANTPTPNTGEPPQSNYRGYLNVLPSSYVISNKVTSDFSSEGRVQYYTANYFTKKHLENNPNISFDRFLQNGNQLLYIYKEVIPPTVAGTTTYIAQDQAFRITATGLRPNTTHYFSFNTANVSVLCQPEGNTIGSPLVSSANGTLVFDFYYTSDITANITSNTAIYTTVMQYRDQLAKIVGNKQIVLNNTDDTSRAEGIIAFIETETVANNYVKKEIFPHQKHEY
jgi:hypothetical protein